MENQYEKARVFSRGGSIVFLWEDKNGFLKYGSLLPNEDFILIAKFVDGIDVMDGVGV